MAIENIGLYPITIDVYKKHKETTVYANDNDSNGRGLLISLVKNGAQFDSTGITLKIGFRNAIGEERLYDCDIVNALEGQYKVFYPTEMLSGNGGRVVKLEIKAYEGTGALLNYSPLFVYVNASEISDDAISGTNEASTLVNALSQVQNIDNRFNSVNAQLAENAKKTNDYILLSDYCTDNTGVTPMDVGFLQALNYAKDNKLKIRVDGKFLLKNNYIIPNNTVTSLVGDGVEKSKLIFDLDTAAYALEIKTYHIRPLQIRDLEIRQHDKSKLGRNGVKVDFGGWGGSVDMENVYIFGFTGITYNNVNTFNCRQENVQLYGEENGGNYLATLLKIEKTNGIFSNLSTFKRCGFQYGKIAIQNLGGANYTFENCQIEHNNLILHAPQINNPSLSNRMSFDNCWFEKNTKGIITADMDENTLLPIEPIVNKSNIYFLSFTNNYDGGGNPENILNSLIEPILYKTFTLSSGAHMMVRIFDGWTDIPLSNGWTGGLKSYRHNNGMVVLIGTGLTPGTSTPNTIVAELPIKSAGVKMVSALNGNSADILPNAFWINTGSQLLVPASPQYTGAPHSFMVEYMQAQ